MDANDIVVTQLPWLDWGPVAAVGGVPCVSLDLSQALAAFAIKCKLDRAPANLAAARPINCLTLRLNAAAWSRVLTAVRDYGFAGKTLRLIEELHAYIRSDVPLINITAADWMPAPALGVGATVAARAASARIRFLSLASVASLEAQTGVLSTAAPWTAICKLVGALGGVSLQAPRLEETSTVQSVAEIVRAHSTGGTTDAALAFNLRSNVMRAVLPKVLRAHGPTPEEQSEELADAFAYKVSDADRKAVEQKRIYCILPWCETSFEQRATSRMHRPRASGLPSLMEICRPRDATEPPGTQVTLATLHTRPIARRRVTWVRKSHLRWANLICDQWASPTRGVPWSLASEASVSSGSRYASHTCNMQAKPTRDLPRTSNRNPYDL